MLAPAPPKKLPPPTTPLAIGEVGGVAEDFEKVEEEGPDCVDDRLSILLDVSRWRVRGASWVSRRGKKNVENFKSQSS